MTTSQMTKTSPLEHIRAHAETLRTEAAPSDELGRLTDTTVKILRDSGVMRLYAPTEYGGAEAHPVEFMEAAMEVGQSSPPAGWVTGVVGVHPWEIAMMDPRLQEEIWGQDHDVWTASPYAPFGVGRPVDGGYLFTGQWPYSTGTDASDWVILGGMVGDADGTPLTPPQVRHFVIPRKDYEIVEDSWNVMGLKGTGSKDVRMKDVFVPDYRTVGAAEMNAGAYEDRQPGKTLYRLKFPVVFSAAINSGTQGIAEGALRVFHDYVLERVSADQRVAKQDPVLMHVYAEAAADIAASRTVLLNDMKEIFDFVDAGGELTMTERVRVRRNGVRAVRRSVDAIDRLYKIAGSQSIHERHPNERFWRDMQAGMSHICNVDGPIYNAAATLDFGGEITNPMLFA
ncbi:acyl-CoA dehydrogenase family protein [Janibacter anophelis]|uniref:acyl-CoA dehydrogenase family protein n=1 Tax=Janibacter anophelis TaxID=319054 RepID=UPI003F7E88BC